MVYEFNGHNYRGGSGGRFVSELGLRTDRSHIYGGTVFTLNFVFWLSKKN